MNVDTTINENKIVQYIGDLNMNINIDHHRQRQNTSKHSNTLSVYCEETKRPHSHVDIYIYLSLLYFKQDGPVRSS